MLTVGIKGKEQVEVVEENTARVMGSGVLDVLATPALLALVETTALKSVESELEDGSTTVGISADLKHTAPTPLGMKVTCESTLTAIEDRKLTFQVVAYDEKGEVGRCIHERFLVDPERFQEKANAKRA